MTCLLAAGLLVASFAPTDLFRVRQPGAVAWSPDGLHAVIELTRPGRTLDSSIPSAELVMLDVQARSLRALSPARGSELGFFNAVWSPDGRRLAFLSVDGNALVRPWLWSVGSAAPVVLSDLDVRVGFGEAPLLWLDGNRLAVVAWDVGAVKSGSLYFHILRGRNVADGWRQGGGRQPGIGVRVRVGVAGERHARSFDPAGRGRRAGPFAGHARSRRYSSPESVA
jgi:dipeptidyl aminopeptidase/acylaminoacyl peptidase